MAQQVDQVVILAAGQGIRLRRNDRDYLKPLYPLFDRPLISYVMSAFHDHGVNKFYVVVGFEADELMPGIEQALPAGAELRFIDNSDWKLSNGVSLLKAKGHVEGRFFLSMSDHIFDPRMIETLEKGATRSECLYLAVDGKIETIFDMDDATKVKIDDGRIVDIDKKLTEFDAVDTGLFICPDEVFSHLQAAAAGGDCSLSDGVRKMAGAGKARVVDIGGSRWQDVDTPKMLSNAEKMLSSWKTG